MKCPFLRESHVRSCSAAPHRKIPSASISAADDRCTSGRYAECPLARLTGTPAGRPFCPLMEEELVQFCSALAVPKYVPYNEALLSRCNSDAHRYCPLFLSRSRPMAARRPKKPTPSDDPDLEARDCSGLPERLAYSPNHMWIDLASDGSFHVGIDAFVSRVLGRVDGVRFLTGHGLRWPAAALEVRQMNLRMVFPRRLLLTESNVHLRVDPQPLLEDPYGSGWLYAGWGSTEDLQQGGAEPELIRGDEVATWMRQESDRLTRFVHEQLAVQQQPPGPSAPDGGTWIDGMAQHLEPEQLLDLYQAFFALHGGER